MNDSDATYDTLSQAHGWTRNPSLCVGCAPHRVHEPGACSGAAAHALDSCRCPSGMTQVRENDRPLTCDPLSHKDVKYRATVSDRGIVTTHYECGTCGATWTESRWAA